MPDPVSLFRSQTQGRGECSMQLSLLVLPVQLLRIVKPKRWWCFALPCLVVSDVGSMENSDHSFCQLRRPGGPILTTNDSFLITLFPYSIKSTRYRSNHARSCCLNCCRAWLFSRCWMGICFTCVLQESNSNRKRYHTFIWNVTTRSPKEGQLSSLSDLVDRHCRVWVDGPTPLRLGRFSGNVSMQRKDPANFLSPFRYFSVCLFSHLRNFNQPSVSISEFCYRVRWKSFLSLIHLLKVQLHLFWIESSGQGTRRQTGENLKSIESERVFAEMQSFMKSRVRTFFYELRISIPVGMEAAENKWRI